jgi:hypothetical protein
MADFDLSGLMVSSDVFRAHYTEPTSPVHEEIKENMISGKYYKDFPTSQSRPINSHKCIMQSTPHKNIDDIIVNPDDEDREEKLKGHILVCTVNHSITTAFIRH